MILFLQLSSQVCCFCVSLFFRIIILLLVAVSSIFGCYHFLTRWCWVDEGSFDSWGSSMRFCFLSTRMNRHFPFCRYIIWVDKCFCIYNKEWGDRNMLLWLTCYFVRLAKLLRREGKSLSMLSEGYLIWSICPSCFIKKKSSNVTNNSRTRWNRTQVARSQCFLCFEFVNLHAVAAEE